MTEPKDEYQQRLNHFEGEIKRKEDKHTKLGWLKLSVVAAGLVLAWCIFARHWIAVEWLLAPVIAYGLLAMMHGLVLRSKREAQTAADFYQKGIARIEDRWIGNGQTGERFRDAKHVYAEDLDLFGRGCLFELLSTARLPMGENRLASWLREGSGIEEILARQRFVQELREKLDLREDLAVTGEALRARLNPESLVEWAEAKAVLPCGNGIRTVMALLALAAGVALVNFVYIAYTFDRIEIWPLMSVLAVESAVLAKVWRRAHAVMEAVDSNAEGLLLYSKILERLEREQSCGGRLGELAAELKKEAVPASRAVRKFARIAYWIDAGDSLVAKVSELPFLYSVQVGMAAEAWRKRWGPKMRRWAELTGEMEALLSLAGYSYEHPEDTFPEFVKAGDGPGTFEGEELGHPLIAAAKCVRNSVKLDPITRVLLVSGSNMSGKSTFLRVVGINAVMAMAGGPIRGKRLRLTPLKIGTRIRSSDSLQEGRSNFFTEILHIRQVFADADGDISLVFLFDELLEGTNSKDRRIGAEGLLNALLKRRAIGIVTTHDLALTEISTTLGNSLRNVHFEDQVVDGKMRFDYRLRDGVVQRSNALELMRLIGLET